MNKGIKILLFCFTFIVALWIVGRMTNALQYFSMPTTSSYPTIKVGERFFASNLIKPERFDFICFRMETPEFGKSIYVFRLCGIEGDKIEIRDGILYVNGQNADYKLSIAHNYFVPSSELPKLTALELDDLIMGGGDTLYVTIPDQVVKANNIKATRQIKPKEPVDEYIQQVYAAPWNEDHFGPLVVPEGKFFVLGDNRHSAQDSRWLGFIDKTAFVGTVIGRK